MSLTCYSSQRIDFHKCDFYTYGRRHSWRSETLQWRYSLRVWIWEFFSWPLVALGCCWERDANTLTPAGQIRPVTTTITGARPPALTDVHTRTDTSPAAETYDFGSLLVIGAMYYSRRGFTHVARTWNELRCYAASLRTRDGSPREVQASSLCACLQYKCDYMCCII